MISGGHVQARLLFYLDSRSPISPLCLDSRGKSCCDMFSELAMVFAVRLGSTRFTAFFPRVYLSYALLPRRSAFVSPTSYAIDPPTISHTFSFGFFPSSLYLLPPHFSFPLCLLPPKHQTISPRTIIHSLDSSSAPFSCPNRNARPYSFLVCASFRNSSNPKKNHFIPPVLLILVFNPPFYFISICSLCFSQYFMSRVTGTCHRISRVYTKFSKDDTFCHG